MYKQDYEKSRKYELEFEQFLQTKYRMRTENTDEHIYFPYWDISSTGGTNNRVVTFEIKFQSHQSKVFIEDGQSDGEKIIPTCLSLTTADYYVFCFKDDEPSYHLIKVDKLKELCYHKSNVNHREITYDKNGYKLYILKREFLKEHTIKLAKNEKP